MENPAVEIKDVIRGLTHKPSLDRQERIIRQYFSPDCKFYHLYANVETGGINDVISLYQIANIAINYQDVEFYDVVYDPAQDKLSARINVFCSPWTVPYKNVEFELHIIFELEDFTAQDGRRLKRIKVQRDYFQRSVILLLIPIFTDIYSSSKLRTILGHINATIFRALRNGVKKLL